MAVGRISGPLLKENLIRNGIDLAFETDLLYLDVNNQRIGIKTTSPTHELQISGTTKTTNLIVDTQANLADVTILGNTISSTQQYLNLGTLDNVVYQNKAVIDSIDIEGNVISTNSSNANLEFRPNGTGTVEVQSDMNVTGNIHATGNITADGDITIGDANTDTIILNAEVASNIIPDVDRTYNLGSDPSTGGKEWNDIWVNNFYASNIVSGGLDVDGIDLTLRQGNIIYVAENGNDANSGTHPQDPYASVVQALSAATAGDTIHVYPGVYTEQFPLTVPVGVTLKGQSLRSVTIQPTTETRYNDAVIVNGESTVEDVTLKGFYSGGNYFEITDAGASPVWPEQQKLTASDPGGADFFGFSVAIDGDTAIIGAYQESNQGAAYVFTRSGGTWTQQQKLTASDAAGGDRFGYSVAISGDTVVVGAYLDDDNGGSSGSAYVFTRSGGTWTEQQKLTASDAFTGDYFGYSVAISGDTVVVGAYLNDDNGGSSGSAYVFTRSGGTWTEQQKLTAIDAAFADRFGYSVAISGDTAVVGARGENNDAGAAYVFTRTGGTWTEQQKLTNNARQVIDYFGSSVAIDGDTVVVGTPSDDDDGSASGSATIFTRTGSTWTEQQKLTASDAFTGDNFGLSVAISGDTVVVGAYLDDDDGASSGSAYVFKRSGSTWNEQEKITASDAFTGDYFGYSVAISGDTVVVGAYLNDDNGGSSGSAYIFNRPGGTSNTTVNVGITDQAHSYDTGGTITIDDVEYTITGADYNESTGVLEVYHTGGSSTVGDDVFLSGLTFSCISGGSRTFPDNGYAFRFATDFEVTTRSPYIKNITVITAGSTTTAEDPRGFNAGDAGKGAYIDGAYATANSKEASMLFHSATFITPGVDAIVATNGVRIEWLNSFTYFANRSFYAFDSTTGKYNDGKTRIRLGGVTGTFAASDTVTFTSTDASTVAVATVESIDGDILVVDGKFEDLIGFDTTPQSISNGTGATATTILNYDLRDFGAEIRMIGSASVYGNYGLYGNGPGVIIYAIGHNLAYIGVGKEVTNDPLEVIQANEVVELNDAKIRYNSVDHKGDFRVGDLFYVNQEDGTVSFSVNALNIDLTNGVTFTTGGSNTFISGERIDTGNLRISGNTIESLSGDITFSAATDQINLQNNVAITGNLDVTGDVSIGGNIQIGDEATDSISIVAGINSNLIPATDNTYSLGTETNIWSNLYVDEVEVDDITINTNVITTTTPNADLELRANGTGNILVPNNNVQIDNNLTVNGLTTLANTNITGTVTLVGDLNQTGDTDITGDLTITQTLTVDSAVQFEEILVEDNFITTTTSNADLELRANGSGQIVIPSNDVVITNDLTINGTLTVANISVSGTVQADTFSTGNILIDDNYITTTLSNSNLELRANGTGNIVFEDFSFSSNVISTTGDLILQPSTEYVQINSTGALKLPVGTTAQRPSGVAGQIRYNTNLTRFEGHNGVTWIGLKGVEDLDGNTRVTAELTEGANDNIIRFDVAGSTIVDIDSTRLNTPRITVDDIQIDGNVISTITTNTDLQFTANGTGSVAFDNFAIKGNTITNTVANSVTLFDYTGEGYVKFNGTYGMVLPVGTSLNRPNPAYTETGMMRFNTADARVEVFDGIAWVSVAGSSGSITAIDAQYLAIETVLYLG